MCIRGMLLFVSDSLINSLIKVIQEYTPFCKGGTIVEKIS